MTEQKVWDLVKRLEALTPYLVWIDRARVAAKGGKSYTVRREVLRQLDVYRALSRALLAAVIQERRGVVPVEVVSAYREGVNAVSDCGWLGGLWPASGIQEEVSLDEERILDVCALVGRMHTFRVKLYDVYRKAWATKGGEVCGVFERAEDDSERVFEGVGGVGGVELRVGADGGGGVGESEGGAPGVGGEAGNGGDVAAAVCGIVGGGGGSG